MNINMFQYEFRFQVPISLGRLFFLLARVCTVKDECAIMRSWGEKGKKYS